MSTAPPSPATWPDWSGPTEHCMPPQGSAGSAAALDWLEALGERQGWPTRTRMALALCADEALANIALHARTPAGTPAQRWLSCGPTAAGLALCIEDDGLPFDPTTQPSPELADSLDEMAIGGHGLRLMRHYLHQLLYQRTDERNRLLLEVAYTQAT